MEHHFNIRLRERFPHLPDPEATRRHIWQRIRVAIARGDQPDIERVMPSDHPGRTIWRAILPEGIIYVAADNCDGAPLTALTQEQVRATKDVMRGRATSVRDSNLRRLMAADSPHGKGPRSRKWGRAPGMRT